MSFHKRVASLYCDERFCAGRLPYIPYQRELLRDAGGCRRHSSERMAFVARRTILCPSFVDPAEQAVEGQCIGRTSGTNLRDSRFRCECSVVAIERCWRFRTSQGLARLKPREKGVHHHLHRHAFVPSARTYVRLNGPGDTIGRPQSRTTTPI